MGLWLSILAVLCIFRALYVTFLLYCLIRKSAGLLVLCPWKLCCFYIFVYCTNISSNWEHEIKNWALENGIDHFYHCKFYFLKRKSLDICLVNIWEPKCSHAQLDWAIENHLPPPNLLNPQTADFDFHVFYEQWEQSEPVAKAQLKYLDFVAGFRLYLLFIPCCRNRAALLLLCSPGYPPWSLPFLRKEFLEALSLQGIKTSEVHPISKDYSMYSHTKGRETSDSLLLCLKPTLVMEVQTKTRCMRTQNIVGAVAMFIQKLTSLK